MPAIALRIHWLEIRLVVQEQHAEMVAVVLKLRLRPGGTALIALAIRDEVSPLSLEQTSVDRKQRQGDQVCLSVGSQGTFLPERHTKVLLCGTHVYFLLSE